MKKSLWVLVSAVAVVGGTWLVRDLAVAQPAPEEKTITISQSRFEALVQERIAAALAKEKEKVTDQKVLQPENWHRAIFNGMEFAVYTGPGQAIFTRWAPQPGAAGQPAPGGAKPVAPKATEPKPGSLLYR
ncbi:MAG: hypothetical protein ABR915_11850 [Thermoguttaceae bacterium]|jgi:hypothetical protein